MKRDFDEASKACQKTNDKAEKINGFSHSKFDEPEARRRFLSSQVRRDFFFEVLNLMKNHFSFFFYRLENGFLRARNRANIKGNFTYIQVCKNRRIS